MDDPEQIGAELPKTPPREQAPVARSAVQRKVRSGLLPVMSLADYKPTGLDVAVQRLDTPEELTKRFQQPVFGKEARRGSNMLPGSTRNQRG